MKSAAAFRISVLALVMVAFALAQGPAFGRGRGGFGPGPMGFGAFGMAPGFGGAGRSAHGPVAGLPFTAAATIVTVRPGKDGQNVTRQQTLQLARDTDGRTAIQTTLPAFGRNSADAAPQQVIYVNDPVARVSYVIYPSRQSATERNYPPAPADGTQHHPPMAGGRGFGRGGNRPAPTTTSLGQENIAGFTATGTQRVTTIPARPGASNQQPVTETSTAWYSAELQLELASQRSGPRGAQSTYTVQSLQQGAPDAALFSVPAGYTVRTVKGHGRRGGFGGGAGSRP